jgi:hypothetical protein
MRVLSSVCCRWPSVFAGHDNSNIRDHACGRKIAAILLHSQRQCPPMDGDIGQLLPVCTDHVLTLAKCWWVKGTGPLSYAPTLDSKKPGGG